MKHSAGILPRFAGFFAGSVGLILFITGIYMYSSGSLAIVGGGVGAVVSLVAYPVVFASLGIAVVLSLLRLAMSPVKPVPALLFLWLEVLIVLCFILPVVREATEWHDPETQLESSAPSFPLGTVLRAGRLALIADEQTGLRLENVVTVDFNTIPRASHHDRLFYDPASSRFVAGDGSVYSTGGALFPDQRSVEIPMPVAEIVRDLIHVAHRLAELGVPWRSMSLQGYLEIAALALLLTALWTCARISQWFLLNVALTFLAVRAALCIYSPVVLDFVRGQLPLSVTPYSAAIVITIAATVLIIVAILLPPLSKLGFNYEK